MNKVRVSARSTAAVSAIALLALTACSSQKEDTTVSAPTTAETTVSASATASASASATASASPSATATSVTPSATSAPSASVTTVEPSQVAPTQTPVVQEETQAPPAPAQETTAAATTAPAEAAPAPTVSVITVPAPGNNPVATATATSTAPAGQAATCDYSSIHIAAATAEGAAGSRYITLTFTNSGANPCMIAGWPTVNYVDASGNAIGAPASQAAEWTSSGELLQPGKSATATLRETRAGLYGDTCQAVTASGYQVGIPGTDSSLTLSFPAEACSNKAISQLSVGQVGANS